MDRIALCLTVTRGYLNRLARKHQSILRPVSQESEDLKRGDPEDSRLAAIEDMSMLRNEQVSIERESKAAYRAAPA